jgi:vacuolar-type H+-ATPase subunit E/Vma4
MAEELKELIEKIQLEGIKAAEDKALVIEAEARKRADDIIASAEKEAARMKSEAREQIERLEEGAKNSIKQASRDTLLSLRREIAAMLERLVAGHVHKALSAEDLSKILLTVIKGCGSEAKGKIVVTLNKEDLDKVEKALLSELGQEAKKGITLKSTADIRGGFLISYDGGGSYFDFSDKALAEYLAAQLKAGLGDIVKESVSK